MAVPVVGLTGNVQLPSGFSILVKSGSLSLNSTLIDTSNTSTSGGNFEGVCGMRSGSGTAIGIPRSGGANTAPGWATIPSGNVVQTPAAATFTLVNGSCSYSGNMLITSVKIGFVYQGSAALSFSFTFSGAIVETWA